MDLSNLISTVLQSTQQSNQRILGIADMLGQNAQQMTEVNTANTAEARADIPQAEALAGQQAQVQEQNALVVQSLQAAAKLDPKDAENAYVTGLAEYGALSNQRKEAHAQAAQLASVSLLDNPIGYIMAQLKLPQAQAQAQALDAQAKITAEDVNTRLTLLNNAKNTVTANTVQQVKEIQLGQAALAAREANRKLSQADMENRSRIAGQYLQQAQVLDKVNDNNRAVYSMQIQALQYEETKAARAEARAERVARVNELASMKAEEQAKHAAELERANAGLAAASGLLGYPQPVTFEMFQKMPAGPQKQRLSELAATNALGNGLMESFTAFVEGKGTIAGLKNGGNMGFAKFMEGIDRTVDEVYVPAAQGSRDKFGKAPNAKDVPGIAVRSYEDTLIKGAADPKDGKPLTSKVWDTQFTPYRQHIGLLDNAITSRKVPPLTGNVLYDSIKAVAATAGTPDGNITTEGEQQALRVVAKRVAAREINENDAAAQIARYYQTAAAVNKDYYQYTLAGLPVQDSYIARVKVPGVFDHTTKPYNVMRPEQAKALIMEMARAEQSNAPVGFAKPPTDGFFSPNTFSWIK